MLSPADAKRKELLLDRLIDYLCETDEYTFDAKELDAILAELDEIEPVPPITDMEESLAKFYEMHKSLFEDTAPEAN